MSFCANIIIENSQQVAPSYLYCLSFFFTHKANKILLALIKTSSSLFVITSSVTDHLFPRFFFVSMQIFAN